MVNYNIPDFAASLDETTLAVDDLGEVYDLDTTTNKKIAEGARAKGYATFPINSVSAVPSAPTGDEVQPFYLKRSGLIRPGYRLASGRFRRLQNAIDDFNYTFWLPVAGGGTTFSGNGATLTAVGTAGTGSYNTATLAQQLRRIEYTATASASAVVGWRAGTGSWGWSVNSTAGLGGFYYRTRVSVLTGVIPSQRLFAGVANVATITDVEPSSLINILGFGFDSADANIQFMHNDNAGTATKVNTGIAVPTTDRSHVYDIGIYCAPGSTTIYFFIEELVSGATYSNSISSADIPAAAAWVAPYAYSSVGGVSNVIGLSFHGITIETEY